MLIVVGAFGTISECTEESLRQLDIRERENRNQTDHIIIDIGYNTEKRSVN